MTCKPTLVAPWALLRAYGPGWDAFMALLEGWRSSGELAGLRVECK